MQVFGAYLMVDWSAAAQPRTGPDSIWIARLRAGEVRPELENPATRAEATDRILAMIAEERRAGRRVLAGFDFALGYPEGFAAPFGGDWRGVWSAIAAGLTDGPANANDRFDFAARLNGAFEGDGPFWGNGLKRDVDGLPRTRPKAGPLPRLRHAEARATGSQEVWKLNGIGSVGGQTLTGIAALERIRLEMGALVWPFEEVLAGELSEAAGASGGGISGKTNGAGEDLAPVFVEIYPSMVKVPALTGRPLDAAQVAALSRGFARLDLEGRLARMLEERAELPRKALREEASILGLGHETALQTAIDRPAPIPGPAEGVAGRYDTDPATIRAKSFSAIRSEARLEHFGADMQAVVVRLIEACGMAEVADRLAFSGGAATQGRAAMTDQAPVFCDCEMVAAGIRAGLPTAQTRTGIVPDQLGGAVVAIGSDPVALFKLLEALDSGAPRPAVILAFPAGFVGAAESKAELAARPRGCDFITLRGRRGGAAMAAAAVIAMGRGLDG